MKTFVFFEIKVLLFSAPSSSEDFFEYQILGARFLSFLTLNSNRFFFSNQVF